MDSQDEKIVFSKRSSHGSETRPSIPKLKAEGGQVAEIAEGISLINGVRGANVYLISAEDGSILVDSGLPRSREALLRYLEERGVEGSKYLALTHADMGHQTPSAGAARSDYRHRPHCPRSAASGGRSDLVVSAFIPIHASVLAGMGGGGMSPQRLSG